MEFYTSVQVLIEFLDILALKLYVCFLNESYAVEKWGTHIYIRKLKHVQSIPEKFCEIPCIYHIDRSCQPRIQIFPKESEYS